MGMSLAVMALLGHVSAVQLQKYPYKNKESSLIQTDAEADKEFTDDEGDQFMAESIKEAENEVAKKRPGVDILRETFDKNISDAAKMDEA